MSEQSTEALTLFIYWGGCVIVYIDDKILRLTRTPFLSYQVDITRTNLDLLTCFSGMS